MPVGLVGPSQMCARLPARCDVLFDLTRGAHRRDGALIASDVVQFVVQFVRAGLGLYLHQGVRRD